MGARQAAAWVRAPTPEPPKDESSSAWRSPPSINVDIWVRKGIPAYPVSLPHILGVDGAGIVEGVGPEAEGIFAETGWSSFRESLAGTCSFCLKGQDNQCDFSSSWVPSGRHYTEYVLVLIKRFFHP